MPFQAKKVEFWPDLAGGKRPRMISWIPHNDHKKSSDDLNVIFRLFWNFSQSLNFKSALKNEDLQTVVKTKS